MRAVGNNRKTVHLCHTFQDTCGGYKENNMVYYNNYTTPQIHGITTPL